MENTTRRNSTESYVTAMDTSDSDNDKNSEVTVLNINDSEINDIRKKIKESVLQIKENFKNDMGKVNIIIAGKSGVGKSTLINSIFHENLVSVGTGMPITQGIKEYKKEGFPLSLIDTKGIELDNYEEIFEKLKEYILYRRNNIDEHLHVHIAWICISENSHRIENAEIELINMIGKYVPVIIVITKSDSNDGLKEEIEKLNLNVKDIIRVMAKEKIYDDGYVRQPYNLDYLVRRTNELIPEAMQNAFIAAQKVLFSLNIEKAYKIIEIHKIKAEKSKNKLDVFKYGTQMIIQISGIFCLDLDAPSICEIIEEILFYNDHSFTGYIKLITKHFRRRLTNSLGKDASILIELFGQTCVNSIKEAFECRNREKPTKNDIILSIYKQKEKFNKYN